ncbi:Thioredoxin reductase [Helicobacter heilmannii ASB1.4]|nr:Thioredoxin reductase [Helicobacter heilmannii ASB1.4]
MVEEIKGDSSGVNTVVFKNTHTGVLKELSVPGIFIFVGYEINNDVLKQDDKSMLCACDPYGAVVVDLAMKTNIKGLFAAGDVRTQAAKQVVCAAGDGATAALSALAYLEGHS